MNLGKEVYLILGDQLNEQHSWFQNINSNRVFVLMELRQETNYVKHHIQKIAAFFIAMRRFAQAIEKQGHTVYYLKLAESENAQSLEQNLTSIFKEFNANSFHWQQPDEYRLDLQINTFCQAINIPTFQYSTEHFFTERDELARFFHGKKTFIMESFYRHLRTKHQVLMNGKEPLTGQWNYDADNRLKYDGKIPIPQTPNYFYQEWESVQKEIQEAGIDTIGFTLSQSKWLVLTREDALHWLNHFCSHLLKGFGPYEDAMVDNEAFLFHSRLSFALNTKLISPKEVIEEAVKNYLKQPSLIAYSSIEGFVRQVLGWREYIRGIYWSQMPHFKQKNFFNHLNPLPDFYWNGQTKMACMKDAATKSLENAYAHHIQRLMILGNFALLLGVNPNELDQWYLGVYADAIEWVELPNTRGMSQFADGGIVGTKPYVASANYVKKMSNYCKSCSYQADLRIGDKACPFNTLYWNFYLKHQSLLQKNPRIGMVYKQLAKMAESDKKAIQQRAEWLSLNINKV